MEPSRGTGTAGRPIVLRLLSWLPPFLLGAAAATAAELSAGLLLYSTEGLLRALTVLLATDAAALGVGLASSAHLEGGDLVAVRRRWMLALIAFGGAAGFSAAWGLGEGFSAAPVSQGLGLALLGGLPLYAAGAVLGALGVEDADEPRGGPGRGAAAALGAGAGVLLTGFLAVPDLEPTSVYLFCIVGISVGALVHGWILDRRVLVRVLARLPEGEPGGPARLEERYRPATEETARVIRVRDRVADGADREGGLLLPWQKGVVELLGRRSERIERALVVGVGLEALARELRSVLGSGPVVTEEPWRGIRTLVEAVPPERHRREGGRGEEGPVGEDGAPAEAGYDAVIVNLRLLPGSPVLGPALPILERAAARRSDEGILALGGLELAAGSGEGNAELLGWISERRWAPALTTLRPAPGGRGRAGELIGDGPDLGGALVLGGPSILGTGLLEISGMRPVLERGDAGAAATGGGRPGEG